MSNDLSSDSMNGCFYLTLVRHGETDENVQAIIQGYKDTKLNQTGRQQALSLAQSSIFNSSRFNRVYSSDLSRAYDTCLILLSNGLSTTNQRNDDVNHLEKIKSKIITDRLLRERSFGQLEGHSMKELINQAREANVPTPEFIAQGGESLKDVHRRVITFLEQRILSELSSNDNILLVSHGGIIRQMIEYLSKFDCSSSIDRLVASRIPPNTSFSEFKVFYDFSNEKRIKKVECIRLHEITHLDSKIRQRALNQPQINTNIVA